jgi:hypothetical protein
MMFERLNNNNTTLLLYSLFWLHLQLYCFFSIFQPKESPLIPLLFIVPKCWNAYLKTRRLSVFTSVSMSRQLRKGLSIKIHDITEDSFIADGIHLCFQLYCFLYTNTKTNVLISQIVPCVL